MGLYYTEHCRNLRFGLAPIQIGELEDLYSKLGQTFRFFGKKNCIVWNDKDWKVKYRKKNYSSYC